MFARLMPQENQFFDLFNAQAELISQGARELGSLVDDLVSGKDALARHVAAIDDIEKRGDKITHDTVALLHTTFNTPLDRDEIHNLINGMDDILDLTQDVAQSIHLYDVRKLTQEACDLSNLCVSCCEGVKTAVSLLESMANAPAIISACQEIGRLESDADSAMRDGMAKLFRDENIDTRQLIKLKALYELLETITDRCEDVANIIEGIVLENS